jgi:hypothetical protein
VNKGKGRAWVKWVIIGGNPKVECMDNVRGQVNLICLKQMVKKLNVWILGDKHRTFGVSF